MIHRLWHGWTTPENADAYEDLLRTEVLPGIAARNIPGYHGATLQRRQSDGEVEFMTTLRFESLDAVRAFAGEDYSVSYVPTPARELLSRYDERATHYTIVLEPGREREPAVVEATVAPGAALADAVRATIGGPMWHGPTLRDAVSGLSAEQAAGHPIAGAHSIWELVSHVGAWADIARERIAGRTVDVTAERNFPSVDEVSEAAWQDSVHIMEARYAALAAAVAPMTAAELRADAGAGQPPVEVVVRGVVEHGVYHAGQMSLLRRGLGISPPAS